MYRNHITHYWNREQRLPHTIQGEKRATESRWHRGGVCVAGGRGGSARCGGEVTTALLGCTGPPRVGTARNRSAFVMEPPQGLSFMLPACSLSYAEGPSGTGNLINPRSNVSGPWQRRSPKPQAASHSLMAFSFGWPEWSGATGGHHPPRNNPSYIEDRDYVTPHFASPC